MNHSLDLVPVREVSDPQLQHRLLAELDGLLKEIEDGIVKENSFTGCIALGNGSLPPLNENQSRQIKEALSCAPAAAEQPATAGMSILSSVFKMIRSLWESHDADTDPAQNGNRASSLVLDRYGRVKSEDASPAEGEEKGSLPRREIRETDVKELFAARGGDYTWVLPYAWDIANRLNAVKKAETEGDLALFLERRRKLNVRRPLTTLFEQSVQRYAAKISELHCDEKGNIIDAQSLESFIRELVTTLLDRTKIYWPTTPLLAIFDGLVATVMRPLLHKHQTAYIQSEMTTAAGVIVSGSMVGNKEVLATIPKWNERSQRLVASYVKQAFKAQVWSFFMDRYAPYNRAYSRSPHPNAATLENVGWLCKSFGDPVHLGKVMELLQPTSREDELAQYVIKHFRSSEFIDH